MNQMTNGKPSKETLEKWHNDPSNWKLGIFYYNKSDKRIFPPKRFRALGWTVNFANPCSYGFLILLMFLLIAYMRYIK
jgi:uncharacterized membrane protein